MRLSIISVGPPYRGGISDLSALLYEELSKQHQIQFINYSRQYPALLFPGKTEYKVGELASDFSSMRVIDSINPLTWIRAAKLICEFESDWALIRYWNPFFGPLIGFIAKRLREKGVRVGIIVDNLIPHEESFIDSMMARRVLANSDHVFPLSKSVAGDVVKVDSSASVTTMFHPLYEIYKARYSRSEAREQLGLGREPVILYFGLIRPYKGLDILIRALGQIHSEMADYHTYILGEAYEDAQQYLDLIQTEGISETTTFRNEFVNDDEVPLYFAACDVLVLPYRTATQSGIVGIALQMNRPVIVTQVGGLGEYVEHGSTGYLVEPENPKALGEAILKFFKGNDREDMPTNIETFKQQFSIQAFCDQLTEVLARE